MMGLRMNMIKDFNKVAIIAGERSVSYTEMLQRIALFATYVPQEKGAKTIILSENREGWIYAFYSVWANKGVVVPVDATSTSQDIAYILRDCQPECICVSLKKADTARQAMEEAGVYPRLIIIDDYEQAEVTEEKAVVEYDEEDTAVIIYTSGTTGSPKGVMLSFRNLMVNIRSVSEDVPIFNEDRRTLILLPVHHVLPLVGTVLAPLMRGGGVAICPTMTGPDIMETMCRGKIAIMVGVPRLWQTLYMGIKKKIDASPITRFLFWLCATVGSQKLSRTIFSSVRKKMGGHITYFVSGGAALDKEIGNGLRTLGLDVLEGYGMTECAPMISFTRPGDIIPGCAGRPLPVMECKIVNDELWAKGPNVMQGYYNRPEETAEVLDADGFIHTGDLARFDEQGRVYITGRSKEIIVLSNGKNVQPNEIEYKLEKFEDKVKEAAVVQDGDLLRAIIVPQKEWACGKSDVEIEKALKREVLESYNLSVANYKKLMSVFVYRDDLPRTRLDKLQRFKLKDIIAAGSHTVTEKAAVVEPTYREYQIIKKYIEGEKNVKLLPTDHIETDLAFDSLDKVGLQGFIEHSFGVKLKADEMAQFRNVTAMVEYILDRATRVEEEHTDWSTLLNEESAHLELPTASCTYPFQTRLFKLFFRLYNRFEIHGVKNIPVQGPFILAPNHQSYIDGPLVMAGVPKNLVSQCYFYATEEHVRSKFRKRWARRHNVILMERSNLRNSILKMAEVLKEGRNIVIFPEGSRTHSGQVGTFKKTFAILSQELNVPIVPVRIEGAYNALPRGRAFIRPCKVQITYLPAVLPEKSKSYTELAEQVREIICNA